MLLIFVTVINSNDKNMFASFHLKYVWVKSHQLDAMNIYNPPLTDLKFPSILLNIEDKRMQVNILIFCNPHQNM